MAGRPSSSDRARRLLALLPQLARRDRMPLSELAAVTGSDPASLTADLTLLSVCGGASRGPDDLVAVMVDGDDVVVFGELPELSRPVRLTAGEVRALSAALEACGVDPDGALLDRLETATTRSGDPSELAEIVRAAAAPGGLSHTYATLVACVGSRRVTVIRYCGAGDTASVERRVRPLGLFADRSVWYLVAHCETAGDQRTFRLDRIESVTPTGTVFEDRPGEHALPAGAVPAGELPVAEIAFSTDGPDLTARDWPGADFERRSDGTVVARVPFAGHGWVARRVVARLGTAEVIAPPELRDAVVGLARRVLSEEA